MSAAAAVTAPVMPLPSLLHPPAPFFPLLLSPSLSPTSPPPPTDMLRAASHFLTDAPRPRHFAQPDPADPATLTATPPTLIPPAAASDPRLCRLLSDPPLLRQLAGCLPLVVRDAVRHGLLEPVEVWLAAHEAAKVGREGGRGAGRVETGLVGVHYSACGTLHSLLHTLSFTHIHASCPTRNVFLVLFKHTAYTHILPPAHHSQERLSAMEPLRIRNDAARRAIHAAASAAGADQPGSAAHGHLVKAEEDGEREWRHSGLCGVMWGGK